MFKAVGFSGLKLMACNACGEMHQYSSGHILELMLFYEPSCLYKRLYNFKLFLNTF